eukprot:2933487-Pyramimonas_sp.AAC.1
MGLVHLRTAPGSVRINFLEDLARAPARRNSSRRAVFSMKTPRNCVKRGRVRMGCAAMHVSTRTMSLAMRSLMRAQPAFATATTQVICEVRPSARLCMARGCCAPAGCCRAKAPPAVANLHCGPAARPQ